MTDESVRYATTVTAVGGLVEELRTQGMLVLFAAGAPEELHDVCALHRPSPGTRPVQVGDILHIDGWALPITAVGDRANDTLSELGHVSLKANGLDEAPLPGDICVAEGPLPPVTVGSTIYIDSPTTVVAGAGEGD